MDLEDDSLTVDSPQHGARSYDAVARRCGGSAANHYVLDCA